MEKRTAGLSVDRGDGGQGQNDVADAEHVDYSECVCSEGFDCLIMCASVFKDLGERSKEEGKDWQVCARASLYSPTVSLNTHTTQLTITQSFP